MSPYEILSVPKDASADDVKAAFRREASKAHPDREGGSSERMAAVNEAYAVLSDPARRQRFDDTGETGQPESIADQATQMLAAVFSQGLQQDAPQLLQLARGNLSRARQELLTRVSDLRRQRTKPAAASGRSGAQMGGVDMSSAGIIDTQLAGLAKGIELADRGIQVVEAAEKMLAAYDEDQPPVEAPAWGGGLNQLFKPASTHGWQSA